MAKRDPTKDALDALAMHRDHPASPEAVALYRTLFKKGPSLAVAKAAKMAVGAGLSDLESEMASAFPRFMKQLPSRDRNCAAKTALAEALDLLNWSDVEPFLTGVQHVQLEGTFGPPEDRAASLRGRCAAALVRVRHPDALRFVVDLLYDPWLDARLGAVRAAGYVGGREGEMLLRGKIRGGVDPDTHRPTESLEVLGLCFTELLNLAPQASLPLVASYLPAKADLSRWDAGALALGDEAALALGASREADAGDALCAAYRDVRRSGWLLPLALSRHDEALRLLLTEIRHGPDAVAAVEAMLTVRLDEATTTALADAVAARDEETVTAAWAAGA